MFGIRARRDAQLLNWLRENPGTYDAGELSIATGRTQLSTQRSLTRLVEQGSVEPGRYPNPFYVYDVYRVKEPTA